MEHQNSKPQPEEIDWMLLFQTLWKYRKKYFKILPIVFVVSSLLILSVPRYYECTVTLVPESSTGGTNSLASLASSFGFNIGGANTSGDAIMPTLYPDLLASSRFATRLFDVEVETLEGDVKTNYYDYLRNEAPRPWWGHAAHAVGKSLRGLFGAEPDSVTGPVDVFRLTQEQEQMVQEISKKVLCDIDKKTDVITITVQDCDPLICASLADSVRVILQEFITEYRTNKTRIDLDFARTILKDAKADYEDIRRRYVAFYDANNDVIIHSVKAKLEDLEKEMNVKYTIYSNLALQEQTYQTKLQERTPAFTVLQGASVPNRPAGPKRTIFVLAMLILAAGVISAWVIYKENDKLKVF